MQLLNRNVQVGFQRVGSGQVNKLNTEGNLRISFEVVKDDGSTPNHAEIQIYNLARETRRQLTSSGGGEWLVYLYAGYMDDPPLIFLGDITKVSTEWNGPDAITTVESGDGQKAVGETRTSTSYASARSPADAVADIGGDLAENLGMERSTAEDRLRSGVQNLIGDQEGEEGPSELPGGSTFSGNATSALGRILRGVGLSFTIQDRELIITKPGVGDQEQAYNLTPDTGLIESPEPVDDGRLEVTSLLIPEIKPLRVISVESEDFQGEYVCRRVKYVGDSGWDEQFYCKIQGTEV